MYEKPRITVVSRSSELTSQVTALLGDSWLLAPVETLADLGANPPPELSVLIMDSAGTGLSPAQAMQWVRANTSDLMTIVLLEEPDPDAGLDAYSSGAFRCLPVSHLHRLVQIAGEAQTHAGLLREQHQGQLTGSLDKRHYRVLYQDILEDQSELILRFQPNGTILYANGALCRFFDVQLDEVVGRQAQAVLGMGDQDLAAMQLRSLSPEHPTATSRDRALHHSQAYRWLEWRHRALFDATGRLAEYQSVGRDITEQVLAEERLKRERNFYSTLIETTRAFVVIIGPDGRITEVNQSTLQMLGVDRGQMVGHPVWEAFARWSDDPLVSESRYEYAKTIQSIRPLEVRFNKLEGSWVTTLWWSTPVFSADGEVESIIATGIDISGQKRTEQELQALNLELENRVRERTMQLELASQSLMENQERLNRLLEVSPVVIYAANPTPPYRLQFISENLAWLTGFSLVEYLSKPGFFLDRIHPDDLERVLDEYASGIQSGRFISEYRYRRKTGEYIWVLDEVNVNFDERGQPQQLVGAFYDVTKRKQAEEAVRVSQERYRMLAEAAQDFIYVLSKEGVIEYMNGVTLEKMKVIPDMVVGRNQREFFPPEIADGLQEFIEEVLQAGVPRYREHPILMPDHEIWAGTWMAPFPIEQGQIHSVLAVSRDITESRRAELELQRALEREKELSDLKTRFVSMTSHEFRTPLSTILSSAELLEHYGYKWTEQKKLEHLRKIQGAVKHLTALLEEVLVIGRADAGRLPVNPEEMDLAEFCAGLVEEVQLGEGRFHPIHFSCNAEPLPACTDPVIIRQILFNLLSNAVKYSAAGSQVKVTLTGDLDGGWAELGIRDQGTGISAEDQVHIYQPFHRGKNSVNVPGTGLGLAIVRRSLDLLKGDIQIESQEGVGTNIRVRIPLRAEPVPANGRKGGQP